MRFRLAEWKKLLESGVSKSAKENLALLKGHLLDDANDVRILYKHSDERKSVSCPVEKSRQGEERE